LTMLKKAYRLTKRGSFDYVYKHGKKTHSSAIMLVYLLGKNTKVGFSVSKKIGKATVRNLVKRRLRAIVRQLLPQFEKKAQIVFLARPEIVKLDYKKLQQVVVVSLQKANFLQKQN